MLKLSMTDGTCGQTLASMNGYPQLSYPVGMGAMEALAEYGCVLTYNSNEETVRALIWWMKENHISKEENVILVTRLCDRRGDKIIRALCDEFGQIDIEDLKNLAVCVILDRDTLTEILETISPKTAKAVEETTEGVIIVVLDYGTAIALQIGNAEESPR